MAVLRRLLRPLVKRKAINDRFSVLLKSGKISSQVLQALGRKPSLAMKEQVVRAYLRNRQGLVLRENVLGSTEIMHPQKPGLTHKLFRKFLKKKSRKPQSVVFAIPQHWKTTLEGKYSTEIYHPEFGKVWVEFRINEHNRVDKATMDYGIVRNGERTNEFYLDSEKKAVEELSALLEKQLRMQNKTS